MTFIIGDDGINHVKTKALEFDGIHYPGIIISYDDGVGESPEDEYVLYYDPETYKMAWLGYTVSYFSKEKSKEFHFIKYADWQTVDGLQLPKTLQWNKYENNLPTKKRYDRNFVNASLSNDKPNDSIFVRPDTAKVIQ